MSIEKPPDRRGEFEAPRIDCTKCGGSGEINFQQFLEIGISLWGKIKYLNCL
ncbi:MAG: hypothetical protein WA865_16620 [Spirulinaceae cyanobacterium]